jgi:hypothetical protein
MINKLHSVGQQINGQRTLFNGQRKLCPALDVTEIYIGTGEYKIDTGE